MTRIATVSLVALALAPLGRTGLAPAFPRPVLLRARAARRLGRHDPGSIVWDEMVAYWLTVAFVPLHWTWLLAAFLLFRLFDIVKPWPIKRVERRLGGGLGIMADDVIAAAYAMLVLAAAPAAIALF